MSCMGAEDVRASASLAHFMLPTPFAAPMATDASPWNVSVTRGRKSSSTPLNPPSARMSRRWRLALRSRSHCCVGIDRITKPTRADASTRIIVDEPMSLYTYVRRFGKRDGEGCIFQLDVVCQRYGFPRRLCPVSPAALPHCAPRALGRVARPSQSRRRYRRPRPQRRRPARSAPAAPRPEWAREWERDEPKPRGITRAAALSCARA